MRSRSQNPRLAVVLSHPTQYYSPWFRWMATRNELNFRVFYLWQFGVKETHDRQFGATFKWDVDLLSGYEHEFVRNTAADPGTHHFRGLRNPELTGRLSEWEPDAILLFGYKWETHLRVITWARARRIPLIFRGDSHFLGRGRPPLPRRLLLRTVYAQFAAFLPVGEANEDYFRTLGVPQSRLFRAPHSVDHSLFDPKLNQHVEAAAQLRRQLGISDDTRVVLFAGKLVPAKQPRELLDAFLAIEAPNTALVFVGDGQEKPALLQRAGADPRVRFLPFANQSEMPARFLLADVFVLPSRGFYETWGLAVNEAMHMGVPALLSDLVGCQRDLVQHGQTGWVFSHAKPDDLRARLAEAVQAVAVASERQRLRDAVLSRISRFTYDDTTRGLLAATASLHATA